MMLLMGYRIIITQIILSETRFCYIVQVVLELTTLLSQSLGAGISGSRYFVLPSVAI